MLKNIFKIVGIFLLGIFGGIFGSEILWPYLVGMPLGGEYPPTSFPLYSQKTEKIIIQENTALRDAIKNVEKAVIGVKTITKKGKVLEGSGLILTTDGLAITLSDLVPKGGDFTFYFEGKEIKYQILKRDLKKNLVLIKLEEKNLPTVSFGNLEKIKMGERVFLVGFTFEKGKSTSPREQSPAILKKFTNEGIVKYFDKNLIQTNIFEKKGLGSPLFDIEGNVLGLNYLDEEGQIRTIPITILREFANL